MPNIQKYFVTWLGILNVLLGSFTNVDAFFYIAIFSILFSGFRFLADTIIYVNSDKWNKP